jgi:hypothetical protein
MPSDRRPDLPPQASERADFVARLRARGLTAADANAIVAGNPSRRAAAARLKAWLKLRPKA